MTILGHSWGGFLAMQYALKHPESIDKLVLFNSTPPSTDDYVLFMKEVMQRITPYEEQLQTLEKSPGFIDGDPDINEKYWQTLFKAYCYQPEKVYLLNLRMSPQAAVKVFKVFGIFNDELSAKPFDFHDQLKRLKINTLIIHGDADPIPAVTIERIHESIANSKYILLKECGHFPYVESPDLLFKHLNAFLNEKAK
jgi:proline iminopeptidase